MFKTFLFLVVGAICIFFLWLRLASSPVSGNRDVHRTVTIDRGMGVSQIAALLQDQGIIRSPLAFSLQARFRGMAGDLKAGTFTLSPAQAVVDVLEILSGGQPNQITVTIPEGFSVADIDALLTAKGLGRPGNILDCAFHCDFGSFDFLPKKTVGTRALGYGSRLEGYLFPETYFVAVDAYQPKFFLERLLRTFRERVANPLREEIARSHRSLNDVVTIASFIEEETRHEDERATVAGILWKRLDAHAGLGVDATVRYVLGKPRGSLTEADLRIDSPYNTRKHSGLPPTPIANPGLSAIRAALDPRPSPYWYYLHDQTGTIHYAVTNDEHSENKRRYLY